MGDAPHNHLSWAAGVASTAGIAMTQATPAVATSQISRSTIPGKPKKGCLQGHQV